MRDLPLNGAYTTDGFRPRGSRPARERVWRLTECCGRLNDFPHWRASDRTWPTARIAHDSRKRPHGIGRVAARQRPKFRSARRFPMRHRLRCRGSALCFQVYVLQDIESTISRAGLCPAALADVDRSRVGGGTTGHRLLRLSQGLKIREQLVIRSESPRLAIRWCRLVEDFLFQGEIGVQVDLRRIDGLMTKPECNYRGVDAFL